MNLTYRREKFARVPYYLPCARTKLLPLRARGEPIAPIRPSTPLIVSAECRRAHVAIVPRNCRPIRGRKAVRKVSGASTLLVSRSTTSRLSCSFASCLCWVLSQAHRPSVVPPAPAPRGAIWHAQTRSSCGAPWSHCAGGVSPHWRAWASEHGGSMCCSRKACRSRGLRLQACKQRTNSR